MTGCCNLSAFMDDFHYYWPKYHSTPPTEAQLKRAKKDWRAGSTGWEGVQIAQELITEVATKAASKPLVNIGGNNYAHAGSDLAAKYGRLKDPHHD